MTEEEANRESREESQLYMRFSWATCYYLKSIYHHLDLCWTCDHYSRAATTLAQNSPPVQSVRMLKKKGS